MLKVLSIIGTRPKFIKAASLSRCTAQTEGKSSIIHFTTVHLRSDTRIRVKQVATLARHWPGQVALYVQDGLGDERDDLNGFAIHDTGPRPKGRLRRMTLGAFRMYRAIRRARPRIAHFHDPELLPWALLLT